MRSLDGALLYAIVDTGYVGRENLSLITSLLINGGADIIQLRAKKESIEEVLSIARELAPICKTARIPFILNDYPELVQAAGASGAHVGQDDLSVSEARRLAGKGALIGKSTHSLEQAQSAVTEAPDYIGFGPIFSTPTKPDYQPIGTELIQKTHRALSLPIFCIGGIKLSNLQEVLDSGAKRVVVVSDLLTAEDPVDRTAAFKLLLKSRASS